MRQGLGCTRVLLAAVLLPLQLPPTVDKDRGAEAEETEEEAEDKEVVEVREKSGSAALHDRGRCRTGADDASSAGACCCCCCCSGEPLLVRLLAILLEQRVCEAVRSEVKDTAGVDQHHSTRGHSVCLCGCRGFGGQS